MLKSMINPDASGKKTMLVSFFVLFIGLAMNTNLIAQSYSGGSGTSGDPYQIANKADLKYLSENSGEWLKHFVQTADITFIDADFQSGGDFYNGGDGFIPIGNNPDEFYGSYNGGGYSIENLYINRPSESRVGFFGRTWSPSDLDDIHLVDADITGNSAVGILGGQLYGTVNNCSSTGTVSGGSTVGGLVGEVGGGGSTADCYSTATVTSTGSNAGGFAGGAHGSITRCYSTGNVTGIWTVGGFVGSVGHDISDCYSTGSVTGKSKTGGFAGYLNESTTISDCYSFGNVSRTSGSSYTNIGGFCGQNGEMMMVGTIENCYSTGNVTYIDASDPTDKGFCENTYGTFNDNFFDSELSNQTSGNGATAKNTTQMQTQGTFTNWDFTSTWAISGSVNNSYPYLQNIPPAISTPSTQATNIVFSNVYSNQMEISWTNGDGSKRAVFVKQTDAGPASPEDGLYYGANTIFEEGTQIGSEGWYCVYNGTGTSLTLVGLTGSTDYQVHVCEYNGNNGASSKYLSSSSTNNPKSQSTNDTYARNALDFDGSDDYVSTDYNSEIRTLEFWFNTDDLSSDHSLFGQRYDAGEVSGNWQMHWQNGSNLRIYGYDADGGESMVTNATFETGRWYHIAVTSDGSNVSFYVDGVYDSQHSFNVVLGGGSNDEDLLIGGSGANEVIKVFNGKLDEVRVWSNVRTATEIQENMCSSLTGSESGLVAYYTFNYTGGSKLPDNTSNDNNGSLVNMDDSDWVTSGAAIGDASTCNYSTPTSVNLASGDGDDVTVGTITGSPDGVQIYRVDEEPNVTTPPGGLDQLSQEHYFGVFVAGFSSYTYTLTYNYDGHPGITDESVLDLATRANNSTSNWTEANATLDQGANTLTLTNQSGTEYIIGSESGDNSLPVELAAFTAENQSGGVLLKWVTESEIENLGFILSRKLKVQSLKWAEIASYLTNDALAGHGSTTRRHEYGYTDTQVQPGDTYEYRLGDVDYSGSVTWHDTVEITIDAAIPVEFGLQKAYPNPFNPAVTLRYGLTRDAETTLQVYNIRGQLVETLVSKFQTAGSYDFTWQPQNLSTGVYIVRLQSGNQTNLRKVVFVK